MGLFRQVHFLEILESSEILEILDSFLRSQKVPWAIKLIHVMSSLVLFFLGSHKQFGYSYCLSFGAMRELMIVNAIPNFADV